MTPDHYCQQKAAKSGSSFYASFRFLPPKQRQALTALYAFCREVDDAVDEIPDPAKAAEALSFWRQEIAETYSGKPTHPVGFALQTALQHFDLNQEYLLEIIEGMEMDLHTHSYAEFEHLKLYCYRVASVVGLLAAEIFGYQNQQTLQYAEQLGMAFQLTNIIRDVREDAERGRVYLPEQDMAQFNLNRQNILELQSSPDLTALLAFETARARQYYRDAFAALPDEDRLSQRPGIIMSAIYQATLDKIERRGFNVMQGRTRLSKYHKLKLAWQTARREKKRAS